MLKFIPVRGRKLYRFDAPGQIISLKFIPVRGRKHKGQKFIALEFVEIYPREGTETCYHRGTAGACRVEIYPREGTET